jgi:hypothetical protein
MLVNEKDREKRYSIRVETSFNKRLYFLNFIMHSYCCGAVPSWELNRTDCLFEVSDRRPHTGFDCFSTRPRALSFFILVVLVLITESNLILHAPQYVSFQIFINRILPKFLKKFVVIYFDDIVVYSDSKKEYLYYLTQIFEVLRKYILYNKLSKCIFAVLFLEFGSHLIKNKIIRSLSSKVVIILK